MASCHAAASGGIARDLWLQAVINYDAPVYVKTYVHRWGGCGSGKGGSAPPKNYSLSMADLTLAAMPAYHNL